jgi:hypothetical protein
MDTLHKRLSEIRDLRAEELDLVGGANEGSAAQPTFTTLNYQTSSMVQGPSGMVNSIDDGYTQVMQTDWSNNYPFP